MTIGGEKQDKQKCPHYEGCNAPLCPMESAKVSKNHLWYPDEDVCKRRKDIPEWVKQQYKVARKVSGENLSTYFTIDMLKVPFRVTKKVQGLDPNRDEKPQLTKWRKEYKGVGKRRTSEATREKRRKIASAARKVRASPIAIKTPGT